MIKGNHVQCDRLSLERRPRDAAHIRMPMSAGIGCRVRPMVSEGRCVEEEGMHIE